MYYFGQTDTGHWKCIISDRHRALEMYYFGQTDTGHWKRICPSAV